jgi:hypothetical protein
MCCALTRFSQNHARKFHALRLESLPSWLKSSRKGDRTLSVPVHYNLLNNVFSFRLSVETECQKLRQTEISGKNFDIRNKNEHKNKNI